MAVPAIIFDWGRTLYDSEAEALIPEATAVLRALASKYRLAVVSLVGDGDVDRRTRLFQASGVAEFFAAAHFGTQDKPALYAAALRDLGLAAAEVAVVDDRVVRGIAWGNRHGAITVWLQQGKFAREMPDQASGVPNHIIKSLEELLSLQL